MQKLPTYCPNQKKSRQASSTPYIIFPPNNTDPLTDYVFDNLRPYFDNYLREDT